MLRSEVCFKRISINMFLTSFQEKIKKIYLEYFRFLGNALEDLSRIFQENALEDFSQRYFQEMLQKICLEAYFPTRILLNFSLEECFSKSNDFSIKMFWKISLKY